MSTSRTIKQCLRKHSLRTALLTVMLAVAFPALADWTLQGEQSSLRFVSIKNNAVAELHYFDTLTGRVDGSGEAVVDIELSSIESAIPIRNERMRDMLFDVSNTPTATLSAQIDQSLLASLAPGDQLIEEITLEVALHGKSKSYPVTLRISALGKDTVLVVTEAPVLVNAADHGLDGGIEALREVAGLNAIALAVPVTASLMFQKQP